jgi:hypothetical protein
VDRAPLSDGWDGHAREEDHARAECCCEGVHDVESVVLA